MNKYIISALLLLLSVSGAKAQGMLEGDVNHDGELTVADVTATTEVLLGKSPKTYITTPESFVRENTLSGSYTVNGETKTYRSGYECVDLGLPSKTLWCATNVGGYTYSIGTSTDWTGAASLLPKGWTLPTEDQIYELIGNCKITEYTANGQQYARVANASDDSKYILIPVSCSNLWSSKELEDGGNAETILIKPDASLILSSALKTSQCYIRPVTTSASSDSEIGQGEDNADTYAKKR